MAVVTVLVTVDTLLCFAPNVGILVERDAISRPDELLEAIRLAVEHIEDPELVEACCGSGHPALADVRCSINFEEYAARLARWREQERLLQATRDAKNAATAARRAEFARLRPALVLAMLDRGDQYVCSSAGCDVDTRLTIDHITPLSRGGSDDLANLRFACRRHNSAKGDRDG